MWARERAEQGKERGEQRRRAASLSMRGRGGPSDVERRSELHGMALGESLWRQWRRTFMENPLPIFFFVCKKVQQQVKHFNWGL